MKFKKFVDYRGVIAAFIGFLVTAIALSDHITQFKVSLFGQDTNDLQVTYAKLDPMFGFFDAMTEDFNEVVFVKIGIRNFGDKEYLLTSASMEIKNSSEIVTSAHGGGTTYLGSDPLENKAVRIAPGEELEIHISQGFTLKGISPFFLNDEFKNTAFSELGESYLVHDSRWINRLNKEFSNLYGVDAGIKISLYENFKKPLKTHELKLSEGIDRFEKAGKFQHNFFIGDVRKRIDDKPLRATN